MAGLGTSGTASVINPTYRQVQMPTPKAKGNLLTHLLPTAGGTLGGVGGGALGGAIAGSAILPGVGTVAGGLIGALLGGAAGGAGGKVLENHLEGDALGNGVAGEAITNGVLSAGPLRLLKAGKLAATAGKAAPSLEEALVGAGRSEVAAPLKTSMAGKLDAFGNKQLGKSQWGVIDKPTIRANDPAGTTAKLANMGLTKATDIERTAHAVTGSDGVLNQAVAKAVAAAGPVQTAHLPGVVESSIAKSGIVDSQAKGLTNEIMSDVNLITPDNPQSALDVMRNLKARQQEYLGKGGTYHLATSLDKKRAKVMGEVHDEIQNTLYNTAGANKNLASVLTPELEGQLLSLHPDNPQWAAHVKTIMKSKNVGDLRHAQAPFVNATKLMENGEGNAYSAGGQMVHNTSGLRGLLVDSAVNAVKDPIQRAAGMAAKKVATVAPGAGDVATNGGGLLSALKAPSKASIIRNEGAIGAPLALLGGGEANADPSGSYQGLAPAGESPIVSADTGTADTSNSPLDPANVQQNVQKILMAGGKISDATAYLSLVKTMQDLQPSGAGKPLNSTQMQQANNAQSGVDSLNTIMQTLQSNPNAGKLAALPGGSLAGALTGTGEYRAAIANATDVIGRLRSGGAINADEEKRFHSMLPKAFDTPQTAEYKLQSLDSLFQRFINPQGAGVADQADLVSALGGIQ